MVDASPTLVAMQVLRMKAVAILGSAQSDPALTIMICSETHHKFYKIGCQNDRVYSIKVVVAAYLLEVVTL